MINLGDEVKDKVSGFRGVAVARHEYLQGCLRISVQPPIDKDGKLPDALAFDEPQLVVVKTARVATGQRDTGGPAPYLPKPK